ncbi:MAG: hypothetical protein V4645_30055 [Pseudomonadota bacterium]
MRNALLSGGYPANYVLPDFISVTIEVAIRKHTPPVGTNEVFAFGFATEGTDPNIDVAGPGLTISTDGDLIGMDDITTSDSNRVATGIPLSDTVWTVLKIEWTPTQFRFWRDGVEYTLPTSLVGTGGVLKTGVYAQFCFQIDGGGGRLGYVDYIDIQGVGFAPEVPFWTAFRGAHEINAAAPPAPPPLHGEGLPTAYDNIVVPYSGAVATGAAFRWYKLTISASSWYRVSTMASPNTGGDTFIAIYGSDGVFGDSNEDFDTSFLSQMDVELDPGVYWIAVAWYEGLAGDNWSITSGQEIEAGIQLDVTDIGAPP